MKKIFAALLSVLLVGEQLAKADCATGLMPTFTAQQATQLCSTFPVSSTLSASLLPATDNTYDLGATSYSWRSLYLATSRISKTSDILRVEQDANRLFTWDASSDTAFTATFGDGGTTAVQKLTLSASTSDADDDSTVQLCGGGAYTATGSRGACILLPGEEVAGGGDISYVAGGSDEHDFFSGSTVLAAISSTGVSMATTGQTLAVDSGTAASACKGTGTHNGTTAVTITTTCAATGMVVLMADTSDPAGSTAAQCWFTNIVNGTSFDVDCDQANDATFSWLIVKEG